MQILERILLIWGVIVVAVCVPILALFRFVGDRMFKLIVFVFYLISTPANVDVKKRKWFAMSFDEFFYEFESIDFDDVAMYYKMFWKKYILREKPEKKKPIQLEV